MQHIRRVYVLQPAKYLVDERLKVSIRQRLPRPNDSGQIAFHQFCLLSVHAVVETLYLLTLIEIRLVEVVRSWYVHVVQACDLERVSLLRDVAPTTRCQTYIAVAPKMLKQLDLPQRSLREDLLAEDIGDFLDRNALTGMDVGRRTSRSRISVSGRQDNGSDAHAMVWARGAVIVFYQAAMTTITPSQRGDVPNNPISTLP